MNRRQFLRTASSAGAVIMFAPTLLYPYRSSQASSSVSQVAFVKTNDRATGVIRAIDLLERKRFHGSDLFVKPNFNSADPPPGSTSTDSLAAILGKLQALGAGPLTIGDRSGMGETRKVVNQGGVFALAKEAGAKVVVFDELKYEDWEFFRSPFSLWQREFAMPRLVGQAEGIV